LSRQNYLFNEFGKFNNNTQSYQSRSRFASSQEGDQPDIEFYQDAEQQLEDEGK
jgi:hypothetical protein